MNSEEIIQKSDVVSAQIDAQRAEETQAWQSRLDRVSELLKRGELAAAEVAAVELTEARPERADAWVSLAVVYEARGRHAEGLAAAKTATERDPRLVGAWVTRGAIERALGQYDAARATLQGALELNPKSRSARFNLAGIAADLGALDDAEAGLRALVAEEPDDVETRYLLATILLQARKAQEAETVLRALVGHFPKHFKAQRALAALAWGAEDYVEAFERAKIAARLGGKEDAEVARLLEGSFYVVVAARLTCAYGAPPWPPDGMVKVLEAVAREDGLDGAGSFVEIHERLGREEAVMERVKDASVKLCPKPDAGGPAPSKK